ncbi:hypothetical protein GCM10012275_00680 [Longimycelium tulufanense]|uniref:HTH iclR-type domain-containing protein n=2 Tax=Longimycelium tulufanense TaxID=907463 RepID=A0A8J3FSW8_9PSEU|nr:hypothetical protein GCM10012275_00680 [Longimycelium tulufanense]
MRVGPGIDDAAHSPLSRRFPGIRFHVREPRYFPNGGTRAADGTGPIFFASGNGRVRDKATDSAGGGLLRAICRLSPGAGPPKITPRVRETGTRVRMTEMIGCITSDNGHRTGEIAQTLDRGLAVLELLGRTPEGLSPTQVGRQLELHRSIASRLLTTLLRRGFVHRRPDGKYVLGGAVTTLAAQVPTGE